MNFNNKYIQSLSSRPHLLILILITILIIILFGHCRGAKDFIIIQNLIYIPIVIACVCYERKGFYFSIILVFSYFFLVTVFVRDLAAIVHTFANMVIFIIVALTVSGLSYARRKEMQSNEEAHTQLKRVIDAATKVSIIATDMSGTILMFNSGAEHILGYSSEEVIGKKTPILIHLESEVVERGKELTEELGHPVEGFEVFVAYAKQGKYEERKWTYVKKDGKHITVNLIVTAVKDDKGSITGFLGIATDVTERELIHKTMREVESRFSAIVENAPDGIIFCEIDTQKIIFSNPAMTQLFGYSEKELHGMGVHDLHRPEDWSAFVLSQYENNDTRDITRVYSIPALRKDGKVIFVYISASKFSVSGKKYFTAFFKDVTECKKMEERIQAERDLTVSAIDHMDHPFYVIDMDYKILLSNKMARDNGVTEGGYCYQLTHKRQEPCSSEEECPLKEVIRTNKPVVVEHIHYDGSGNKIKVEVHGDPIFDKDGRLVKMIEYVMDAAKRKKNV